CRKWSCSSKPIRRVCSGIRCRPDCSCCSREKISRVWAFKSKERIGSPFLAPLRGASERRRFPGVFADSTPGYPLPPLRGDSRGGHFTVPAFDKIETGGC